MAPFFKYFLNTMFIEVFVITGTIFSSALAAYSFSRLKWRGRNIVFAMILSTLMMPYAVTLIPTFIGWKAVGAVDTFIPLILPAWLGGGAFNIFLLRQFFMTLPKELDEAAYLDGATPLTILFKIILPLSKPSLIVIGLYTFIGVWNDFLGPLIYLTDESKFTLALGLAAFKGTYTAQWGYHMAAATVILLPILLLFFVAQRYFIEGIALTGGKN
jgi:multiple sugar transport system permease protein